ncbi:MAG: hypothetical protein MZW92_52480 [Comamonadaceae bacterium]|nr:hypothetical protein [Comamonadaceae bacterium]
MPVARGQVGAGAGLPRLVRQDPGAQACGKVNADVSCGLPSCRPDAAARACRSRCRVGPRTAAAR